MLLKPECQWLVESNLLWDQDGLVRSFQPLLGYSQIPLQLQDILWEWNGSCVVLKHISHASPSGLVRVGHLHIPWKAYARLSQNHELLERLAEYALLCKYLVGTGSPSLIRTILSA